MLARLAVLTWITLALCACDRNGSSPIWATGSSTVYPFTKAVADAFVAADANRPVPKIDATSTEAGIARLCDEGGDATPDIANASRQMRRSEFDKCAAKDVRDLVEIPIGLGGVVLAQAAEGPKMQLSRKDLYLALAANPMGKPNTAKLWKDVNASLPAIPIQVLGPSAGSGTRDAFVELMLQSGCLEAMPAARALQGLGDPAAFARTCRQIRSDGVYVEKGEDYDAIVQALPKSPQALGLLGFSYLEQNTVGLRGVPIDGVSPETATIAAGKYPGGRTLYLYTTKQRIEKNQGLRDFLNLYATMWAADGLLAKRGLIPMSDRARSRAKEAIELALPLEASTLH